MEEEWPSPEALARKLREEFATAIGMFAIKFADMERRFDCCIHELLGLEPDAGHALTSSIISFSLRLEILEALVDKLGTEDAFAIPLTAGIKEARVLNGYRNSLLHDKWSGITWSGGEDPKIGKARMRADKRKKTREWQFLQFTRAEIDMKALDCERCGLVMHRAILVPLSKRRTEAKATEDGS